MLTSHLDHITIVAPSLAEGVEYVRQTLGVTPQPGGEHPRMATHNALLRLGDQVFLEVIAINPDAPAPDHPRWFDLDQLNPDAAPRLATWVARTNDIQATVAAAPVALGSIEPMSRGSLHWLITIPQDGSLPLHGIAPTLIQWHNGPHPADKLPDQGCTLVKLEGFHPQADQISSMLQAAGLQGGFSVYPLAAGERPYLVAHIRTPDGLRLVRAA
jgi:catechol 2,3-dioxygenase-like lactoylglutathione lyase family enzyme